MYPNSIIYLFLTLVLITHKVVDKAFAKTWNVNKMCSPGNILIACHQKNERVNLHEDFSKEANLNIVEDSLFHLYMCRNVVST